MKFITLNFKVSMHIVFVLGVAYNNAMERDKPQGRERSGTAGTNLLNHINKFSYTQSNPNQSNSNNNKKPVTLRPSSSKKSIPLNKSDISSKEEDPFGTLRIKKKFQEYKEKKESDEHSEERKKLDVERAEKLILVLQCFKGVKSINKFKKEYPELYSALSDFTEVYNRQEELRKKAEEIEDNLEIYSAIIKTKQKIKNNRSKDDLFGTSPKNKN